MLVSSVSLVFLIVNIKNIKNRHNYIKRLEVQNYNLV